MRTVYLTCLLLCCLFCNAQISAVQRTSLNNFVDYINYSADEVSSVVQSVINYYPTITEKQSWGSPRYVCPVQLENYYYEKALKEAAALGSNAAALVAGLKALRLASENIDVKCKALDTYHKLEDYKQDNFAEAKHLIAQISQAITDYNSKRDVLFSDLSKVHKKWSSPNEAYVKASEAMRTQLNREALFISLWKFNLNNAVHTGWIDDQLQTSIIETEREIRRLQEMKPELSYPASSMWPSFIEGLQTILETKRHALDGYNHEARKSDKHSNEVYLSLINYYNGVLVADFNAFMDFARDNYAGLKAMKFIPQYEVRSETKINAIKIKEFTDKPVKPLSVTNQKTAITKPTFTALSNFVDYINETYRTVSQFRMVCQNLSSSAAYYATVSTYANKGGMTFQHKDFVLPLSYYQKVIEGSKNIPTPYSASLLEQAEVIMSILKELDQIGGVLEKEIAEKAYERDRCKHVYELLERSKFLHDTWDEKKESLYRDVLVVADSYPASDASSSWIVSARALRDLTELDHEALFKARAFYKDRSNSAAIPTVRIDEKIREVISAEYTNMKGIQKIGRNNGLCPYTPYEDLPKSSKYLSEAIQKLTPARENQNGYQHPYYNVVYHYNDVVQYYNKFAELSPVPVLKNIKQPELFRIQYPASPADVKNEPLVVATPVEKKTESKPADKTQTQSKPIVEKEIVSMRDTVYIEKRDTIYIASNYDDNRSMEGYATNNMVLLLDVSGSMNTPEKLPLLKKSVSELLSIMRKEDRISLLIFSGKPKVILENVSFTEEEKINKAINSLKSSGTTDANAGIKLAYKIADSHYIRGGNNRIILATDGEFGIGEESLNLIERFAKQDIFLSVFNFGKTTSSGKTLERMVQMGKGNYEFISRQNIELKLLREAKAKRSK